MAVRPAPRIVEYPGWRTFLGLIWEWGRLLVGVGTSARSTRGHLWLVVGWLALASAAVVVGRGALGDPASSEAGAPSSVSSGNESAPETGPGTESGLDLSPLARSAMFEAPVVRVPPRQNAIVPDLGNELQLQGVIGGDDPQAIIFHKRTQQTHSVRIGQKFGEFEVIEIRSMKVILKWRDETVEISI